MNEHLPIIKIELEGLRLCIAKMLSEYQVQFSEEVNRAIERFCSSEYLQRVIDAEVRHNIEYVVKWVVDCMNDECPATPHTRGADGEDALRAWNTRAVDPRLDQWLQERCNHINEWSCYELPLLKSIIDLLNEEE